MSSSTNQPTAAHHNVPALARSKRRPALDGIRALSVIVVMVYHAKASWLPGGFLSVNVFFVLSGYLITGLLLKELARWGSIDLASFYKNRARRLLPALFVVVAVVTALGSHLLTVGAKAHLRGDALSTLFYVANWRFIIEGESYFANTGDPSPFRHMWTLAIEEQFYFIFPLLLLLVLNIANGRRRTMARCLVGLIVISAIDQAWIYTHTIEKMAVPDPSRIYYGTDTRANELLLGAALAIAMTYWNKQKLEDHAEKLTIAGILAFIGIFAFFFGPNESDSWVFLGGSVLFSILICVIIVAIEVWPTSIFAEALSWKPIVWIGELSYGIYLWHWPIFVFLNERRTGWNDVVLLLVRLAITFVLATISYYYIEQPIRTQKLQRRIGRQRAIQLWSAVLPVSLAVVFFVTQGIKAAPAGLDAKSGSQVNTQAGSGNQKIGVIGDSVGYGLAFQFPAAQFPGVQVSGSAKIGCGTAEQWLVVNGVRQSTNNPECNDEFNAWHDAIASQNPQVVLWSMGGWDVYDHFIKGQVLKEESPQYATYYRSRLEQGLKAIGPSPQVFIPLIPCYNQPSYVVEGQDLAPNRNDPKRHAALNTILQNFAHAHPNQVHLINPGAWLCPGGKFVDKLDGQEMRIDGVHYSQAGATKFWTWLMPQMKPYLTRETKSSSSSTSKPAVSTSKSTQP